MSESLSAQSATAIARRDAQINAAFAGKKAGELAECRRQLQDAMSVLRDIGRGGFRSGGHWIAYTASQMREKASAAVALDQKQASGE